MIHVYAFFTLAGALFGFALGLFMEGAHVRRCARNHDALVYRGKSFFVLGASAYSALQSEARLARDKILRYADGGR